MRVERLVLQNFRGIRDMDLEFHPKLTVLVGRNGAGKSSVLDAIAGLFARCVNRINKESGCSGEFLATDTAYGCDESQLLIHVRLENRTQPFVLGVSKGRSARRHPSAELTRDASGIPSDERLSMVIRSQAELPVVLLFDSDRAFRPESERESPRSPDALLPFERKYPKESAYTDALHNHKRFPWLVQWFKDREEIEIRGLRNISHNVLHKLRLEGQVPEGIDRQLESVRTAIEQFTGLKSPRFHGDPLRFVASKGGTMLPVTCFSEGEKGLLVMVGDLARRLAIANPTLDKPLAGAGVVMIDDIELHLHPTWQRMLIPRLVATFPNIQFIVTTHSPQVLGEVNSENVVLLEDTPEGIRDRRFSREVHGMTSSHILEAVMETPERTAEVADAIRQAYTAIEENDLINAKAALAKLSAHARDIPELERIGMRIRRKEAIGK